MIDPNIALGVQPAQIQSPLQAYGQALSLKNLVQQGQLGQQQLQAATLENQQRQIALAQTQALNKAYADAITPGGADGSAANIDTGKLTRALAANNAGARIPGVLQGVNEFNLSTANLAKARSEAAALQTDAAGGLGLTLQRSDYDPRLFLTLAQHAANMNAVDPGTVAPAIAKVTQLLQQDPTGAQAKAALKQVADTWVAQSPGAQEQLNKAKTAQGAADRGTAALMGANATQRELPGRLQGQALTNKKLGQEVNGTQPLSPYQSQDLKIKGGELANSNARLGIEQNRFNQQYGDAAGNLSPANKSLGDQLSRGDLNPALLSRIPGKQAIIDYAATQNENWAQAYATKKAFTDPSQKQAQNLATISRIVGHIGRFEQNSAALGLAPVYGIAGKNIGGTAQALADDTHAISAELEALVSHGVGSVGQVQEWEKNLRSSIPSVRQKSIDEISQLVGSQYEGMNQSYKAGVGSDLPIERYVSPAGRAWMQSKGINVGGAAAAAPAPQPQPGPPAPAPVPGAKPAAAAAPAASLRLGQSVKLKNGKTVIVTAVHPDGTFDAK